MPKKFYFLSILILSLTFVLSTTVACDNTLEDSDESVSETTDKPTELDPDKINRIKELLEKNRPPKEPEPEFEEIELSFTEKLKLFWALDRESKLKHIKEASGNKWSGVKDYIENNKLLCSLGGLCALETIIIAYLYKSGSKST